MNNTLPSVPNITDKNLEKVSRQFALLMAKSKSTDSVGEAENCVTLAQQLLWKHNLEEAQLLNLKEIEKRQKRAYIKDSVRVGKSTYGYNGQFNSRDWKSDLLSSVSKGFFCMIRASGYSEYDTIVGEPQNVVMVKEMFAYLEKQIRASRKTAFNSVRNEWGMYSQFNVMAWKESFARGTVNALSKRLEEVHSANVESANVESKGDKPALANGIGYGTALVTQIFNDLDEAYYEFFPAEHPLKVKEREYKQMLDYKERMVEINKRNAEREERIAAGLEAPAEPEIPRKEYKRRGRKPLYRSTENYSAYRQGKVAGDSIQLNKSITK
jgi:hypothetical protein